MPKIKSDFSETLRLIRAYCPTDMPIRIRRKKLTGGDRGWCVKRKDHYLITINSGMSQDLQVDTLIHEAAHALSWPFEHGRERVHGPQWGVAYAAIYHALVDMDH